MKVSMPTQMILHDRTSLALVCDSQTCADCVDPFRFLAHASDSPPHPTYHAPCSSHFQLQVAPYGAVPNNGTSRPPAVGSGTNDRLAWPATPSRAPTAVSRLLELLHLVPQASR